MILFECRDDYLACLALIKRFAQKCSISVQAYCLMSNHIHIVIRDEQQLISTFIKKLATSFALRYNERNEHVGPVFQGRFFSTPLETDESLLGAVRYVHQNPVKAKIASMEDYEWSSYHAYLSNHDFIDTKPVIDLFKSTESFITFMHAISDDYKLSDLFPQKLKDDQAMALLRETLTPDEANAITGDSRSNRNAALRKLRDAGIPASQACRLTGLGKSIVYRAYKQ